MPTLQVSNYKPPWFLKNGHFQSIYQTFFRPEISLKYIRKRLTLEDNDFIDIDTLTNDNQKVALILHGLESGSDRPYMKGMAKILSNNGWDVVCINFRGCSGEVNKKYKSYHSGEYGDLEEVLRHVVKNGNYIKLDIIGFSLGGNVLLKYLGDLGNSLPPIINKAVAISVPCHLKDSAYKLTLGFNKVYLKRFITSMKKKLIVKQNQHPENKDHIDINSLTDFQLFDDYYTAPAHGFPDANTYWSSCSSINVIKNIQLDTLIITAEDDQFLTLSCYPIKEANQNKHVTLEIPTHGGHVGFVLFNKENEYWHEKRVVEFLKS